MRRTICPGPARPTKVLKWRPQGGSNPRCRRERSTVDEIAIYRTAKLLLDQHGKDATIHAAHRADEMLAKGDLDGRAAWLRVLGAVKELQATSPGKGARLH